MNRKLSLRLSEENEKWQNLSNGFMQQGGVENEGKNPAACVCLLGRYALIESGCHSVYSLY